MTKPSPPPAVPQPTPAPASGSTYGPAIYGTALYKAGGPATPDTKRED